MIERLSCEHSLKQYQYTTFLYNTEKFSSQIYINLPHKYFVDCFYFYFFALPFHRITEIKLVSVYNKVYNITYRIIEIVWCTIGKLSIRLIRV